jgi:hypothetical protein
MAISRKVGVGLVICFLFGIVAGGIGGWHLGIRFLLNEWVLEMAGDVKGHIEVLQKLNAKNVNEAIENLEYKLDDDLIVLEPQGYQLKQHVREKMYAALRAAKQYRMEHPRKSKRGSIDEMVRNVLSREIPEGRK